MLEWFPFALFLLLLRFVGSFSFITLIFVFAFVAVEDAYLGQIHPLDQETFATAHTLIESFRMRSLYQYVGKSYWEGAFHHLLQKQ